MSNSIRTGTAALYGNSGKVTAGFNPNYKEGFNARVSFVLYDDHDKERFTKYGGWEAIGTVECHVIVNNMLQSGPPVVARPLNSNFRRFPVINEVVRIIPATSFQNQDAKNSHKIAYYYDDIINTWDSSEHNAVPDVSFFKDGEDNKPETYNKSLDGIPGSYTGNEKSATGERFKEKGHVRKLILSPGDMTLEGRFGNSIRFGGSNGTVKNIPWKGDDNKPFIIIRNGQKVSNENNWLPIYEDLNADGTSVYFLSGQTISFIPANDNFDSYHQNVQAKPKSGYVEPQNDFQSNNDKSLSESDITTKVFESDTKILPVSSSFTGSIQEDEIKFLPDNENEFFKSTEEIPATNGILSSPNLNTSGKFNGSVNSTSKEFNLVKAPSAKGMNKINSNGGLISSLPGVDKNGKALIDLIALTEGTMGAGNFNGYDIIYGNYLFPGFSSYNTTLPHPNIVKTAAGIRSTATGRYQFLYSTWNELGGGSMNKYNQDAGCWKLIIRKASLNDIIQMDKNYESFKMVIDRISGTWASLPNIANGIKGRYGQAGQFSFELLYNYYKLILAKYK